MRGTCACEVVFKGEASDPEAGPSPDNEKGKATENEHNALLGPGEVIGCLPQTESLRKEEISKQDGKSKEDETLKGSDTLGQGATSGESSRDLVTPKTTEAVTGTELVLADTSQKLEPSQDLDSEAQIAAYSYFGYQRGTGEGPIPDPSQSSAAPCAGYDFSTGQIIEGQLQSGMKWHPQEAQPFQVAAASLGGPPFYSEGYRAHISATGYKT